LHIDPRIVRWPLTADAAPAIPVDFRGTAPAWGLEAVKAGGWTAVATANILSCIGKEPDVSFSRFADLVDELGMMLADVHKNCDSVARITRTQDILDARQAHKIGFLPTLEHVAIDH